MDAGSWVLAGAVGALAVVVLVLVVLVLRLARVVAELRTTPRAPDAVQDDAVQDLGPTPLVSHERPAPEPEFVITSVGSGAPEPTVPDRVVLSATLGEPLVRLVAFGHGVRRALSAENRNRIGFEVRREIKRSRKERRREMREAWQAHRRSQRDAA